MYIFFCTTPAAQHTPPAKEPQIYTRNHQLTENSDVNLSIILGLKDLPLIHSYNSIQALNKDISKSEREHDLVIAVSCILLRFLTPLPEVVMFCLCLYLCSDIFVKGKIFRQTTTLVHVFIICGLWLVLITFDFFGYGDKSYVLGEVPSLQDRITIVRQLWDLTRDVLV